MKRKIFALVTVLTLATALTPPIFGQNSRPRKESKIRYNGGPVQLGANHVYVIYYGNWVGSNTPAVVTDFLASVGGTPYLNINTTYYDSAGARPTNSLLWARNFDDFYSRGINLTAEDIAGIVTDAILSGQTPLDPEGLYFVIASDDVNVTGLCTDYCEFHGAEFVGGLDVRYAFVGNPRRCPSKCATQLTGPSGDFATDAIINWIAHDIAGMLSSPTLTGWFDRLGKENSDKCLNIFGPTYQTPNGALANIKLGGRDYLLQMNWVNDGNGYCAMSYP